jgi:hypothetical protein
MPTNLDVDADKARAALDKAWSEIKSDKQPPAKAKKLIEEVLAASDVTYKYILVTGYLAKHVNPNIHARSLQKGSSLKGAYDARSLGHGVVVGFEKSKGNLFGLSNEPFVNKPARHPEHDKNNEQLRSKAVAAAAHDALEEAQRGSKAEVYAGLVHILRKGAENAKSQKTVEVTTEANLKSVVDFVDQFIQEADGGARLVAVWGAFVSLSADDDAEVKVYSPNMADKFAKTAGDVEVRYEKKVVSASECKQRPLNHDDVKHGLKKANENGLSEYLFVISAGVDANDKEEIQKTLKAASGKVDSAVIEIAEETERYARSLNPVRRAKFGLEVVVHLRNMRKFESANAAVDLWNELTAGKGSSPESK